jgi:hypothetical protein
MTKIGSAPQLGVRALETTGNKATAEDIITCTSQYESFTVSGAGYNGTAELTAGSRDHREQSHRRLAVERRAFAR